MCMYITVTSKFYYHIITFLNLVMMETCRIDNTDHTCMPHVTALAMGNNSHQEPTVVYRININIVAEHIRSIYAVH